MRELSNNRGPASAAQKLYEETADSRIRREEQAGMRKLAKEPAREIRGRPTKRNRRLLAGWKTVE